MSSEAKRYQIGEYVVEERPLSLIYPGALYPWTGYTVTHPSPEGWPRWVGLSHSRREAEALIERDQRWRGTVAGRSARREEGKEAA